MAKQKELIINLGTSHVSICLFNLTNGVAIEKLEFKDLQGDLNDEVNWFEEIANAINEIPLKSVPKGNAKIILPSSKFLTKTLRVPKVEEEKQRKVVSYELSQKLPFPLETLIWDFQVIDDDGIEQEIICIALKPDVVKRICSILYTKGIVPKMICPGSLLDYKALEASGEFNSKDVLLINFGAKSTNLIFKNPSGFLVRTLNIGQHTLSENIATLFSLKIEKAESLKIDYFKKKTVNLDNQNTTKLESVIQNFNAKLMQEISRCLVTYKRLKRGKQPVEIIISGRGAQSSELLNVLANSQKIKLSFFNPFNIISEWSSVDEKLTTLLPFILSEEIGLVYYCLPNTDKSHLVNLLPQKNIDLLKKKQKSPFFILCAFTFSLLPLSPYLNQLNDNKLLTNSISKTKKILNKNLSLLSESSTQEEELEKLNSINNAGHIFVDNILQLALITHTNVEIIDNLQSIINDNNISDIWLDTVKFLPNSETNSLSLLNIEGRYLVRVLNESQKTSLNKNDLLIDSNSKKAELLTSIIENLPFTQLIVSKTFSTEGKGDLFKRNFTHFSFTLKLQ